VTARADKEVDVALIGDGGVDAAVEPDGQVGEPRLGRQGRGDVPGIAVVDGVVGGAFVADVLLAGEQVGVGALGTARLRG
jgi:hypothetical protein